MVEIENIDKQSGIVFFDDGSSITYDDFIKRFTGFFKNRIAGETLMPEDMERFMARTSSKNLKLLMKGKKMEGYLEGSMDKFLTKGQKIAITSIAVILMVVFIGVYMLQSQGVI